MRRLSASVDRSKVTRGWAILAAAVLWLCVPAAEGRMVNRQAAYGGTQPVEWSNSTTQSSFEYRTYRMAPYPDGYYNVTARKDYGYVYIGLAYRLLFPTINKIQVESYTDPSGVTRLPNQDPLLFSSQGEKTLEGTSGIITFNAMPSAAMQTGVYRVRFRTWTCDTPTICVTQNNVARFDVRVNFRTDSEESYPLPEMTVLEKPEAVQAGGTYTVRVQLKNSGVSTGFDGGIALALSSAATFTGISRGGFDSFGFYDFDSPTNRDPGQSGQVTASSHIIELYRNSMTRGEVSTADVTVKVTGTAGSSLLLRGAATHRARR